MKPFPVMVYGILWPTLVFTHHPPASLEPSTGAEPSILGLTSTLSGSRSVRCTLVTSKSAVALRWSSAQVATRDRRDAGSTWSTWKVGDRKMMILKPSKMGCLIHKLHPHKFMENLNKHRRSCQENHGMLICQNGGLTHKLWAFDQRILY